MKSQVLTLITIFCLFINSNLLFSQTITEEEKQKILSDLSYSYKTLDNDHNPYDAAKKVIEFGITEAEPILINNIWKQNLYTRELFLHALNVLKSPRTHELILEFIDSTDTFKFKEGFEENRLEYKAIINEILFDLNDFSKRKYLYDYIENYLPKVELPYRLLLEKIITKYSKDELPAKNSLIRIAKENLDDGERVMSLLKLYEIYGNEILPLAMERFVQDPSWFVRNTALTDILGKNKTNEIHTILMNRTLADPDDTLRIDIADSLLNNYGSPIDFQIAKKLYTQLRDTSDQSYYKQYVLDLFKPNKDDNSSLTTLLDSLLSYQNQCVSFNWLGDSNFSSQLLDILNEAKSKLTSVDSLGAAIKIKQYQSLINEEYTDSLDNDTKFVTKDGWTFLYYYPQYILDKLPKLPTNQKNSLGATVRAQVVNENNLLKFTYTVTNADTSKQSIANVYVENAAAGTTSAPVYWQTEKIGTNFDRFYTTNSANQITAGTTKGGYTLTSNSLPVIGKVYIQSERFSVDTLDIKTNSYIATTVIPSIKPALINASAFIDTLISYNNRAYSLGWMQYYWVRDNNYYQLNNAKTMINMNIPSSAVVILTAFESWLDTIKNLAYINDEGYALLKYNSIFLREKLSGQ